MTEALLHDGNTISIEVEGAGPTLLLPVNPYPLTGPQAEQMRQYGNDPALGQNLIQGLRNSFRVVAFDYEGLCFRTPRPDTLTPANLARDFLAVADAVRAEHFAYYGYSWLAVAGLQLAIRTDRLSALITGGWPPLNAPYEQMLRVTAASYQMAIGANVSLEADEWSNTLSPDQTKQFMTLYQTLQDFNDREAQALITCPRLCFVGSTDEIQYGKNWGDVHISLTDPVIKSQAQLAELGWDVRILEGLDHIQAMQASQVVPLIRPWLTSKLLS